MESPTLRHVVADESAPLVLLLLVFSSLNSDEPAASPAPSSSGIADAHTRIASSSSCVIASNTPELPASSLLLLSKTGPRTPTPAMASNRTRSVLCRIEFNVARSWAFFLLLSSAPNEELAFAILCTCSCSAAVISKDSRKVASICADSGVTDPLCHATFDAMKYAFKRLSPPSNASSASSSSRAIFALRKSILSSSAVNFASASSMASLMFRFDLEAIASSTLRNDCHFSSTIVALTTSSSNFHGHAEAFALRIASSSFMTSNSATPPEAKSPPRKFNSNASTRPALTPSISCNAVVLD